MKNITISMMTTIALSTSTYAGGKFVEPVEAEVAPIVETINPVAFYAGLGLVAAGVSKDCPCNDEDRQKDMTYGALLRVGLDFNQYIGVEARYLNASIEKDFSTTTHYGLFLKPQYHFTKQMNVYGLIGYGQTTVEGCGLNNGELEESGLSYGLGFEYNFGSDGAWGVWADYQNLFHNEGTYNVKTNIFSVGVTYDF